MQVGPAEVDLHSGPGQNRHLQLRSVAMRVAGIGDVLRELTILHGVDDALYLLLLGKESSEVYAQSAVEELTLETYLKVLVTFRLEGGAHRRRHVPRVETAGHVRLAGFDIQEQCVG